MIPPFPKRRGAFTLIELLVASVVLLIIMIVLLQVTAGVAQVWKSSTGKISAYQNARAAFSTISRTLSSATLNTYNDYVDIAKTYRNPLNPDAFKPDSFARTSELHMLSGSAIELVPDAKPLRNPGHAIFFQAPLGNTDDEKLVSLNRTLNAVGFYIQYGEADDDRLVPTWLQDIFGSTKRFRLMQIVEPTEILTVYQDTRKSGYTIDWLKVFTANRTDKLPRARVIAEDVPLLIFRPRLSPSDEEIVSASLGGTYDDTTRGSILSPNFYYDSRAWQTGYPIGKGISATSSPARRRDIMRNQVPPIIDVIMVALDRNSLARLVQTGDDPPVELQVPTGFFTNATMLESNLTDYAAQLSEAGIRFRIFRTAVDIRGAKWSNY